MSFKPAGFLIDIDGVLMKGNQRIDGALEALDFLHKKKFPFLLVTNTTRKSRVTIWHHLTRVGFSISETQILSAPVAASLWLNDHKVNKISLLTSGSAVNDFKNFKITSANPEYLVVGDLGQDATFEKLNTAFKQILGGSKILALQKNRYWLTREGKTMDAGAWVSALEYCSRKRATIIGKPGKDFFLLAARLLGKPSDRLIVIGDNLETDIRGAANAGMQTLMVKTGVFDEKQLNRSKTKPGAILDSIADLPKHFKQNLEK